MHAFQRRVAKRVRSLENGINQGTRKHVSSSGYVTTVTFAYYHRTKLDEISESVTVVLMKSKLADLH